MYEYTKLVQEEVWKKLLRVIPTPKQRRLGRKRCKKEALLNGIVQVLVNGVAWKKIADCGCGYASPDFANYVPQLSFTSLRRSLVS